MLSRVATLTRAELTPADADTVNALADAVWAEVLARLDAMPEWTGATAGEVAGRVASAARAALIDGFRMDGGPREFLAVARQCDRIDSTDRPAWASIVAELTAANVGDLPTD